ncbi:hypothetical protein LA76x_5099 [Lysobacter antibioticus]|uniref:Uncharacterized protein n=2 Tax=Lysobacter antibioticus TaxID=84531 RepID=A0A0S2FI90_LYSAN|nr:hypothetical protein LA76x_5099 [Lysobacter antibioticus]
MDAKGVGAAMSETIHPGTYRDKHGEEPLQFRNDGSELRTTIRGVDFAGSDFDMLEAVAGTPEHRLASFSLNRGDLCECRFTVDIALPVAMPAANGSQTTVIGTVQATIELGATSSDGRLDSQRLRLRLAFAGSDFVSAGTGDLFELELLDLQRQLPEGVYLKACINCLYSDYSPYGQASFGSMLCFRNIKDEYLRVTSKNEFWAVHGRHDRLVQETYLCGQFARRRPGTGYRG